MLVCACSSWKALHERRKNASSHVRAPRFRKDTHVRIKFAPMRFPSVSQEHTNSPRFPFLTSAVPYTSVQRFIVNEQHRYIVTFISAKRCSTTTTATPPGLFICFLSSLSLFFSLLNAATTSTRTSPQARHSSVALSTQTLEIR